MYKYFAALFICLNMTGWAAAQQPMLSPPERPPVPLSDGDQLQAEARARSKPSPERAELQPATSGAAGLFSGRFSSGDSRIDALVREASARYGVDPRLILLVMQTESGFRPQALSPKGATGLMQLMPATAQRLGVSNIFDPRQNVLGGVKYLRWLLDRFGGDVRLALAGYNAGEGAVEFYGNRVPPFLETQLYVRSIVLRYNRFAGLEEFQPRLKVSGTERGQEKFPDYNQIIRFTPRSDANDDATARKQ